MSKKQIDLKRQKTYIGGQAVIEGVMMRGKTCMVTSVRDGDGNILVEAKRLTPPEKQAKLFRLPFFRGMKSMWESLVGGMRLTMRSAEAYADDDDGATDVSTWRKGKSGPSSTSVVGTISIIIGLIIGIGLFFFLPILLAGVLANFFPDTITTGGLVYNLIVGVTRMIIFIIYIALTTLMKDIRRTYMYHGAEHKTITCYESGLPLTVENVRKCRRVHDRCGTTFMFLVMVISIVVCAVVSALVKMIPGAGAFFSTEDTIQKMLSNVVMFLIHLACIPIVAGIAYEILRALAKTTSKFFYIFKAPGLALQHITTREPDDGMIECAINSFKKVLEMDTDPKMPEQEFILSEKLSDILARAKKRFAAKGIEEVEAEWICALTINVPKSSLAAYGGNTVSKRDNRIISEMVNERLTGRPLWYIVGDASFCGYTIKVNENVLIPRPETEVLVSLAGKYGGKTARRVLDLCTGSGAIAIAYSRRYSSDAEIVASDISVKALSVAQKNAELNGVRNVTFVESDMFNEIKGKFDLIISNPPYIETDVIPTLQREVKDFEPMAALDGGKDGLDFYRIIAEKLPKYLKPDGVLLMECGAGQARKISKLFSAYAKAAIIKDFNGVERYIKVQLNDEAKEA